MHIHKTSLVCRTGAALGFALLAGGCAVEAMDETAGNKVQIEDEASAADFEYAPEDDGAPVEKEVLEQDLTAKGSWSQDVNRGRVFHAQVPVAAGQTVTCSTTQNGAAMDTVMALLWRYDGYTGGVCDPQCRHQARFSTMAIDDDSGPDLYSQLTWTNSGNADTYQLVVWGYGSSRGVTNVTCTRSGGTTLTWNDQSINGGSLAYWGCDQGQAHTTSADGGDPILYAIDPTVGGGNGYWNDDEVGGSSLQSKLTSLSNASLWYVMGGYSTGTTTLHCP